MSGSTEIIRHESRMLILLMTDTAVDNFVTGKMELGGTGGFAIGEYGLGVI